MRIPFLRTVRKILTALYENAIPFELRMLTPGDQQAAAEHAALWPLKRMPVLVDGGRSVVETSIIIELAARKILHPAIVRRTRDRRCPSPWRLYSRVRSRYAGGDDELRTRGTGSRRRRGRRRISLRSLRRRHPARPVRG